MLDNLARLDTMSNVSKICNFKPIQIFKKIIFVIKVSSKIYKPKTYKEVVSNLVYM